MVDWTVLLTPLLLLPMVCFSLYIGCSGEITNVDWVEVTFVVSFYLDATSVDDPQNNDHEFQVTITDLVQGEVTSDKRTFQDFIQLEEGIGGRATRLQSQFQRFVAPGPVTYACRIQDLADPDPLVSGGAVCDRVLEVRERYLIAYSALVSDDGLSPEDDFRFCDDELL